MPRRLPWALIVLLALVLLSTRLKFNAMGSLPYGLYWLTEAPIPLRPGVIVVVHTPETLTLMRTLHGSLVAAWPILKPVAAVEGDTICHDGDRLSIGTQDWGMIYAKAPHGQTLPQWLAADECREVPPETVFLASHIDGSLDSRYVGPVPVEAITRQAIPLWTWESFDDAPGR